MTKRLVRRIFHLTLLTAVVCSALFGAFDVSSPFTQSAFADGYPGGGGAACCNYSSECLGTKRCCNPSSVEVTCNAPTKPGYCKDYCN